MASQELQSKVNQLTSKLEVDVSSMVDEIERLKLRPLARNMHSCIVSCYDKAGKNGRKEQLEQCSQQCTIPSQRAGNAAQQEIANFQNRLNNSLQMCQTDAQSMVTPDMSTDSRKMKKVEDSLLKCIKEACDKSKSGLKPMRQRIESQLP